MHYIDCAQLSLQLLMICLEWCDLGNLSPKFTTPSLIKLTSEVSDRHQQNPHTHVSEHNWITGPLDLLASRVALTTYTEIGRSSLGNS